MSDPPVPLMRPQSAALLSMSPAARHSPPARSGPLPALRSVKVLDQLRERIRYLHYSRRTEEAYVHWVRAFIRFHGLRHPSELGGGDIERFLSWLVNERSVAGSTHRQALSALLLCRHSGRDSKAGHAAHPATRLRDTLVAGRL